jgi:hypothetical protein
MGMTTEPEDLLVASLADANNHKHRDEISHDLRLPMTRQYAVVKIYSPSLSSLL